MKDDMGDAEWVLIHFNGNLVILDVIGNLSLTSKGLLAI